MSADENVKKLVYDQFKELNLANRNLDWDSKQMILDGRCQDIIYNEWGIGTQGMWDLIEKYVEELIPSEYED